MGRKREHSVNFWLTDEELIKLKDKMSLVSCNPRYKRSDYIRDCVLGKDIIVAPGIRDLQKDIREISNNLGRLTEKATIDDYETYPEKELKEMKEDIKKIWGKLAKAFKII